jgi:outer membrane lipoprotein-sorting protein
MNRRTALLAPLAAALFAALPAQAAPISLSTLSSYLNGLSSLKTDFTQVNADGSVSTGKLLISRPGRARFEYDPPDRSLVIAGSGSVAIFDAKSNQPPEQYPLAKTPLSLILASNINLGRARMVVGHRQEDTATKVKAQDPDHPEYGTIELVFTDNPVALRQWVITDDMGQQTTVILGKLSTGVSFSSRTFDIPAEVEKRKR